MRGKALKRDTLEDLVEYVSSQRNVLDEPVYAAIVRMVRPASARGAWTHAP